MHGSYQVSIEQPRRMGQTEEQQAAIVESLSVEDLEQQAPRRWKPYEDSKYESPVLNRLFPWPRYYYCRWKILSIFHTRLLFGIVLGEVLVFVLLIGGLAGALGVIGLNDDEGTGAIANIAPALAFAFACRNSLWVLFTGLPFERALFWHKLCAYVSVLVGAWHGYVSQEWNASGLLLIGSMAGLCLFPCGLFAGRSSRLSIVSIGYCSCLSLVVPYSTAPVRFCLGLDCGCSIY